jgi:hypothetical protein
MDSKINSMDVLKRWLLIYQEFYSRDIRKGETVDSRDSESYGNPMGILGILGIQGIPRESRESHENPGNPMGILGIQAILCLRVINR